MMEEQRYFVIGMIFGMFIMLVVSFISCFGIVQRSQLEGFREGVRVIQEYERGVLDKEIELMLTKQEE